VTDFLNFAQFSPNRLNRVVIGDIVSEAVLEAASRFADKGISVVREGRDFCIMADPDRMKAALVNILSNAYEASGAGSAVSVKTSSAEKWGIITIRDQGHGIVKKNLPNIFSPFFTTKKGGTGLGLSISQRIVEAHNGKIEVTSVIGEGTTFRVSLPLA
jgi:two-component system sensor histidine kinase HydH